jgi:hypothetical protein
MYVCQILSVAYSSVTSCSNGEQYKFVCQRIDYTGDDISTVAADDIVFELHHEGYNNLVVSSRELFELIEIRDNNCDENIPI